MIICLLFTKYKFFDYGTCNWILLLLTFATFISTIPLNLMYLCFLNQGYNSSSMGLNSRLSKRWICTLFYNKCW